MSYLDYNNPTTEGHAICNYCGAATINDMYICEQCEEEQNVDLNI